MYSGEFTHEKFSTPPFTLTLQNPPWKTSRQSQKVKGARCESGNLQISIKDLGIESHDVLMPHYHNRIEGFIIIIRSADFFLSLQD